MLLFLLTFLKLAHSALPFAPADVGSSRQMIYVSAPKGIAAEVTLYQRKENLWLKTAGPWPAVIGRSGVIKASEKREGDGHTPAGLYRLGFAFGAAKASESNWPYRQMTSEDKWIDDPASASYNQLVRGKTDAKSFEEMTTKSGAYDLGLVIEYNMKPVRAGKGSAIFLHIWKDASTGTAGCVALAKENVTSIVKWLNADSEAKIMIGE